PGDWSRGERRSNGGSRFTISCPTQRWRWEGCAGGSAIGSPCCSAPIDRVSPSGAQHQKQWNPAGGDRRGSLGGGWWRSLGGSVAIHPAKGKGLLIAVLDLKHLDDGRIGERRRVAQGPPFSNITQQPAHDLARTCLGQIGRQNDLLRLGDRPDLAADMFL